MAKKTQRRPSRNERDQAGCISGLISIFDFRQGRSTRKLLADKRRANKQVNGASRQSNVQPIGSRDAETCDIVEDAEDNKEPIFDIARTSVKKLMEEEMVNEKGSTNQITDADLSLEQNDSKNGNQSKKNDRRKSRTCNKSIDKDISELDAAREQTQPKGPDLVKLMEDLVKKDQIKIRTRRDSNGDLATLSNKAVTIVEDKLVSAVRRLLERRMSETTKHFGEEEEEEDSEFIDALEMLSSNKGQFLKLLQDPNSILVKHIECTEDVRLGKYDQLSNSSSGSNLPEESAKSDESRIKRRNFFGRRSKSLGSFSLAEAVKDNQSSNRIVLLKPGPAGSDSPEIDTAAKNTSSGLSDVDSKVLITRHASQFSFTEIMRKLRHAMGKDSPPGTSTRKLIPSKSSPKHQSSKHAERANLGWSSPNRNHFYTERFTLSSPSWKKDEQFGRLGEKGLATANETSQYTRLVGSNIYIEARKHLSEMLNNGDENMASFDGQLPKPLGRILSLHNYNSSSPCCSPRMRVGDISTTTQTRLSSCDVVKNDVSGLFHENHDNHLSSSRGSLEITPGIVFDNADEDLKSIKTSVEVQGTGDRDCLSAIQSSVEDVTTRKVESSSVVVAEIEETREPKTHEEDKIVSISCESSNCSITSDILNVETIDEDNEESALIRSEESSQCLKLDSSEEDQPLSSPTMSPSHSDYAHEKIERPSPISVLEPLFTDDEISPQSVTPQPVEKDIEPRQIHFEEQSPPIDQVICTRISLEDEESAFEYVEAVLLGSGLNWDEFLISWLSHHEILDSPLFDEVEAFSSQPRHDQKLLFDCANEALKEICQDFYGCFAGTIPCLKQTNKQVPRGMDLINEAWSRVEARITSNPHPLSLDHLVKRDLTRSTQWMDLQSDFELIGTEVEDAVFDELVEDTVLSFEAIKFEFQENAIEGTDSF